MAEFGIFVSALAVAYLMPGPDMALILQTGTARRSGVSFATASGLGLSRAFHVALAALGLAALLRASPLAFEAVRFGGAAYLVWLGIAIGRARSLGFDEVGGTPTAFTRRGAFLRGLLTNVTNPKALLFCSVLLPQFAHPEAGGMAGQFVLLGAIVVAIGMAFDLTYASAGMALGRWLERHPAAQRWQQRLFAGALIGFGIQLAVFAPPL